MRPSPRVRMALYGLLMLYAGLFFASLIDRPAHTDDAWLGEQAYWLSREGHVRSDLLRGLLGYEERQMVYHKLFIAFGSVFIRLWGWSLYTMKAVSLAFYLLFMGLLYRYCRRGTRQADPGDFWLAVLFMISMPLAFEYAFVYRPEMMVMCLGFASFCFTASSAEMASRRRALAGGLAAGLCLATHLNGGLFVIAGGFMLLSQRRYPQAAAFLAGSALASMVYLLDVNSAEDARLLLYQLERDPLVGHAGPAIQRRIINLLEEHKRLFHSPEEIFTSALLIVSVAFSFRRLWQTRRVIILYLGTLMIVLPLYTPRRATYYMILYMPYVALAIAAALRGLPEMARWKRVVTIVLCLLFLGEGFAHAVRLIGSRYDIAAANRAVAQHVPRGATIAAPMTFVFNEISNYRIQGLAFYELHFRAAGSDSDGNAFFELARKYGNTHVLLDEHFKTRLDLAAVKAGDRIGGYVLTRTVSGVHIFEDAGCRVD